MNRNEVIAWVVGLIAAASAVIAPVYIISANATERTRSCVESGGKYVNVPNTSRMECRR